MWRELLVVFTVWHNFRSQILWSHELPHHSADSLLEMKSKVFSTVKLCSFTYTIRGVFCGTNNKIRSWKESTFPVSYTHRYKEMQIFFNRYTHIHACINSWKTTNAKNVFVCNDVEGFHCMETGLTETSLFPGKQKIRGSDREELKSYLFLTGEVLYCRKACRNAVKGSNNRCWRVFGPKRGGSEDIYTVESQQRNAKFLAPDVGLVLGKY